MSNLDTSDLTRSWPGEFGAAWLSGLYLITDMFIRQRSVYGQFIIKTSISKRISFPRSGNANVPQVNAFIVKLHVFCITYNP